MRPSRLTAFFCLVSAWGCSLLDLEGLDGTPGASTGTGAAASTAGPTTGSSGAISASTTGAGASTADTSSASVTVTTTSGEVYADVVMADDPVAYFRFNDVGPDAFDEVSQSMRGTTVGAVGFEFAGAFEPESGKGIVMYVPGAIEIADVTGLEWSGTQAFTVEAWINIAEEDQVPGTVGRIFTREIDGVPPPSGWFLGISIPTVNADFAEVIWERRPDLLPGATITAPNVATEGFRHLVGRYVDGRLALYLDGVQVMDVPADGPLAASGPIRIGAGPELVAPYAGQVDEVAFYDHALTELQIQHHFAAAHD